MSDHDEDEFDDESNEGSGDSSNLVRDLRKQLKAQKKVLDEAALELSTFRTERRKTSVAKLIEDAGGNPAYAKFYTSEDSTPEAVNAWIQAEAELLGVKAKEEDDPDEDQVSLLQRTVNSAPQVKIGSLAETIDRVRSAKTRDELNAAMSTAFPKSAS